MLYGMAAVCALGAAALLLFEKSGRLRVPVFAAALAAAAAAFVLAAVGQSRGLVFFRPAYAPEETVGAFFEAFCGGDEERAGACLADGAQMPTSAVPEDEAAAELYAAFRESLAWTIDGDAERDGLEARVRVRVTALDLEAMQANLRAQVTARLETAVDARAYNEIYDENGLYRPEITEEIYREAVPAHHRLRSRSTTITARYHPYQRLKCRIFRLIFHHRNLVLLDVGQDLYFLAFLALARF